MKKIGEIQLAGTPVQSFVEKYADELLLDNNLAKKRKNFRKSGCQQQLQIGNQPQSQNAQQERQNTSPCHSNRVASHHRSRYHNFQKHSVVLIQKLMKKTCGQLKGGGGGQQVAQFRQSRSKKIIIILFGEADLSREKYITLLISTYFGELCRERQEVVREAQSILRMHALRCLTQSKVQAYIRRNSHIKNKSGFLAYIKELLRQLSEGPLKKLRLSLASSQKKRGNIRTASSPAGEQKPIGN